MSKTIVKLMQSAQTVFSVSDLALLWGIRDRDYLKSKIYYLVKKGDIIRLKQGVFALDTNYNKYDLAAKIKNPSYISLETVLRKHNCIFQYSQEISSLASLNRRYKIDNAEYSYRKIKDSVLYSPLGIEAGDTYSIASCERAFLDMIYLSKNYYFDNLEMIDWELCQQIVKIYENKNLEKRLVTYQKKYAGQRKT